MRVIILDNAMIPQPLLKELKISPICSANLDNRNGLSNIKAWSFYKLL